MLQDKDLIDEFADKEFESNFNTLVDRVNRNLTDFDLNNQRVTHIKEDINNINEFKKHAYYPQDAFRAKDPAYRTSHISHI